MWDGNNYGLDGKRIDRRLSENQCGMETLLRPRVGRLGVGLSENQCGMETESPHSDDAPVLVLSENQCGMETEIVVLSQLQIWLSENQCGMETVMHCQSSYMISPR